MKPLRLLISAFGPYAGKTLIDFEKLSDYGIFLISGNTGSGKTTIFDAISYALYDKSSGDVRDNSMLRSDYADPKDPTYVELVFEHNEKIYTLKRNPSYRRPKLRGEGFTDENADASLICEGKKDALATSSRAVSEKIKEILGITYEQFCKIAMIAQGEFRKVLTAETPERVEILRKVFGTEMYKEAEDILREEKAKAKGDYDDLRGNIRQELMAVRCPEDLEESLKYKLLRDKEEPFLNDIEDAIDLLEKIIKKTSEKYNKSDEERTLTRKNLDKTVSDINKAREDIKRREEIERIDKELIVKAQELKELEEKKDKIYEDFEKIGELLVNIERLNLLKQDIVSLRGILEDREKLKKQEEIARNKSLEIKEYIENTEKNINNNRNIIKSLEGTEKLLAEKNMSYENFRKSYIDFSKKFEDLKKHNNTLKEIKERILESEENKKFQENKLNEKEEIFKSLDGSELVLSKKTSNLEILEGKIKDLENLSKREIEIRKRSKNLEDKRDEYKKLKDETDKIEKDYFSKRDIYYNNMAGILAENLEEGKACPVCGSISHPMPSVKPEKVPSKEELENEDNIYKKMRSDLTCLATKISEESNNIKNEKDRLKTEIMDMKISSLEKTYKEYLEKAEIFKNEIKDLSKKVDIYKHLKPEIEAIRKNLERVKDNIVSLNSDNLKYKERTNALNEDLIKIIKNAGVNENLDFSIINVRLEEKLKDLKVEITEIEKKSECLKNAKICLEELLRLKDNSIKKYSDNEKIIVSLEKEIDVCEKNIKSLREKSKDQKIEDIDNQIEKNNYLKTAFTNNKRVFEEKHSKLEKNIESLRSGKKVHEENLIKEKYDINKLISLRDHLLYKEKELEKYLQAIHTVLEVDTMHYNKVKLLNKNLKSFEDRYREISELYYTVSGNITGLERINLETYIQIIFFNRVLEKANMRFAKMSNNQYELVRRKESLNKAKKSGLDLDVIDHYSGKERPVNSLSGGEMFEASLSLALGLSDLIQESAGGIYLDAMFIDEGFGTLDEDILNKAMEVLSELSEGSRLVGIISHVSELRDRIPAKILVKKVHLENGISSTAEITIS